MAVDDWAPVTAAAGDDWAPVRAEPAAKEPPYAIEVPDHVPTAFLRRFSIEPDPVDNLEKVAGPSLASRVLGAIREGGAAGFGENPTGLPPEAIKGLRKIGIFQDPDAPSDITSGIRFANEAVIRPAYAAIEAAFRGINAGIYAAGALGGQLTAEATGANEAEQARARRDGAHLATVATLLAGANPVARKVRSPTGEVVPEQIGTIARSDDFAVASEVVAGEKAPRAVQEKMLRAYEEKGLHPSELAQDAQADPIVAQRLLSSDKGVMPEGGAPPEPPRPPKPPAEPPAPPPEGSFEAAQKTVLDKISIGERAPAERLTWDKFYTQAVDNLHPLKSVDEGAYELARLTRGQFGKAEHFIEHGTFDFNTYQTNGKPLAKIIEPVSKDLDGLRSYLASKRGLEIEASGRKSGLDIEAMTKVAAEGEGKFGQAAAELVTYQNKTLQYLKDSGVLSDKAFDAMVEAGKNYVPFYRVITPEEGGVASKGFGPGNPVKRLKGSERDVIDPLESIIKNTYAYVSIAERNAVGIKLIDALKKDGAEVTVAKPPKAAKPPPEVSAEGLRRSRAKPESDYHLSAEAVMEPQPYHAFKDMADTLPDAVNQKFQVHGLLAGDVDANLINLLKNGIDAKREFHSGTPRGGTHGVDSTRTYGAPYLLVSEPGQSLRATGVKNVVAVGPAEVNIPKLKEAFPNVNFMTVSEAERFMNTGERPRTTIKPSTGPDAELLNYLKEHGVTEPEALVDFVKTAVPEDGTTLGAFRNGVKETVEVNDPALVKAFRGLDQESAIMLTKVLAAPAKALRTGATLSPDFMVRNVVRDFMTAFVNSKGALFTPVDTAKGLVGVIRKDADFQDWLKGGGANSTMVAMDRAYLQESLTKLAGETGLMSRSWNVVTSPYRGLRMISELAENATRLGEFKKMTGRDKADIQSAAYASREVTLDFARIGASMRAYNMITAFGNAQIQGMDRIGRAFKDAPVNTTAKVAGGITLPSVLLWWANHDDPRYKELPHWQKDMFWIVMTKDHIYRIPKPFELGVVFGSGVERILDLTIGNNPEAFDKFSKSIFDIITPNVTPTAFQPLVEQYANRSTMSDRTLIPKDQEKHLPEYQYTPYTTELAKKLGQVVSAFPGMRSTAVGPGAPFGPVARAMTTPILMENYIRAWTGGLGMYGLQAADAALRKLDILPDPVTPTPTLSDIPVVKAFMVRYPSASTQSIQDFYDQHETTKKFYDTWMAKAQEGDVDAMTRVQAAGGAIMFVRLDTIKETLSQHSKLVRDVYKNPTIKADEKRQLIDGLYFNMIQIGQAGKQMLKESEKALKTPPEAAP